MVSRTVRKGLFEIRHAEFIDRFALRCPLLPCILDITHTASAAATLLKTARSGMAVRRLGSVRAHGRDHQYMQWISRHQPKDKRQKYKDVDKRILKILQEYQRNERTAIELLRGIANNIVIDDVVGIDDVIENDE
ncbi:hypothetical protein Ddc_10406 [Ditylenchus destructor]|nr:hypothetical protein Ddc_10406 [Ditylenchus destructor]